MYLGQLLLAMVVCIDFVGSGVDIKRLEDLTLVARSVKGIVLFKCEVCRTVV
jgi:hypothetical protein